MSRLLVLLAVVTLAGCDVFSPDSGASNLTLSGSRSGAVQGNAVFGTGAAPGLAVSLSDDGSGRTVSLSLPSAPRAGTYAVGSEVGVRYSPGVLSDAFEGVAGTVTLTDVSEREIRGRLDVGAALFSGEPRLQITGTFRAVARN